MDENKNAVAIFDKLANVYQSKFMDVSMYRDGLDFFCKSVANEHAAILELACGPGNITKYVLNQRPKFKITATDLSANMLELAKANSPEAEFDLLDCRKIETLNRKFDAIICGFCLPYLTKSETTKLLKDAYATLNESGILYLSTIKGDYEKSEFRKGSTGDLIFIHYYSIDFLKEILLNNHFSILKTAEIVSKDSAGYEVTDLVVVAQK